MSKAISEKMERDFYDELFMQDAARLVGAELLDDLYAAQDMDVNEVWLQNVKRRAVKTVKAKKNGRRALSAIRRVGRMAAILLLTVCLLFGGVYVTVDAAREKINNYFFGSMNSRNAIVLPAYMNAEDYVLIPYGWTCPIYPTWIPEDFSLISSGGELDRYWSLTYHQPENVLRSLCIFIWDNTNKPAIDVESYEIVSDGLVQGVPATVFYDSKNDYHSLVMTKNDYTIQIIGDISQMDIIQIAELFQF